MKVDLHCHTKKILQSDGNGRNVSSSLFADKIANSEIGIAAITNHNHFDKSQYDELRGLVKDYCQIWPGIELTMKGEEDCWHLLVICNPNQVDKFDEIINCQLIQSAPSETVFSVPEVVSALDNLDIIYIPHDLGKRSGKKSRAIPEDQRTALEKSARKPSRIISEPNHHSLGVLSKHGYRVILGSDVKKWSEYEKSEVADFRIPIASFEAFAKLVEGDVSVYNDIALNNDAETVLQVTPVRESNPIQISIYRGVNIIFGQKGTGKSKLIEAMNRELQKLGYKSDLYKAGEIRDCYKEELNVTNIKADASSIERNNLQSDFMKITNWQEKPITPLKSYQDYKNGVNASINRKRLVIADCGRANYFENQNALDNVISDQKHIECAINEINLSHMEQYIDDKSIEKLKSVLSTLLDKADREKRKLLIEKYSILLFNKTINSIKRHAESLCEMPSSPDGTGFQEYAQNRLALMRSCNNVLESLDGAQMDKRDPFGYIDDKGQIDLVTRRIVFSNSASPADYFKGKKTGLDNVRKSLQKVKKAIFNLDLTQEYSLLLNNIENAGVSSYDDFIGIKKFTALKGNNAEYEPSDGELAIIMMRRFLSSELDYYLLDEPERGMGNSYVDKNIRRDEIMKLAEQGKTVVLATHNANLAVRTMPVFTFLLEYQGKNIFSIYTGSPFSNTLKNLNCQSDSKNWANESMEILEGGEDAFYDRKDMYELC